MEHEESHKVKGSSTDFTDPKKKAKGSLDIKESHTKKSSQWKSQSKGTLGSAPLERPLQRSNLPWEGLRQHDEVALDTKKLSHQKIIILASAVAKMDLIHVEVQVQVEVFSMMLNIPLGFQDFYWSFWNSEPIWEIIFSLYNMSGYFSRTVVKECLGLCCTKKSNEIEEIDQILRIGNQELTSSDNVSELTTTEGCLKYTHEKSKISKPSHKDHMPSISDASPLSSLEIQVLAIHVSQSWKLLGRMLDGVICSKVEDLLDRNDFYDLYSMYSLEAADSLYSYEAALYLLYLYSESHNFSRKILVQSCGKLGISCVNERLKRVRSLKDSLDNRVTSRSDDLPVSDTTRLLWWEMEELYNDHCDYEALAEVLRISLDQISLHHLHHLDYHRRNRMRSLAAAVLYVYNESACFSRATLGECFEKIGRIDLQKKLNSMQEHWPSSPNFGDSKAFPEHSSVLQGAQEKSWSQTTFPLVSTLDSTRLSRQQIVDVYMCLSAGLGSANASMAHMLDIPFLSNTLDYPNTSTLSLYNESRRFSRKKLMGCYKKSPYFEKLIAILNKSTVKDDSTDSKMPKPIESTSFEDKAVEMSSDKLSQCETHLQDLSLHSSKGSEDESEMSKHARSTIYSSSEDKAIEMYEIDKKVLHYVKARSLALRFMANNSSCIRAVPHHTNCTAEDDNPAISMCLYMDTNGLGITDDLREEAKEIFADYDLTFLDLERELLGEYFIPRASEGQNKSEEMAKLAQIIEENLPVFENRLNVTAVYPSYKISNGQETNELCVAVAVLGKRKIPVGEKDFKAVELLGNYPFDIVEGYFSPSHAPFLSKAYPLHLGVGIGVRGTPGGGTLGAFLTDGESYYVLSCQHVMNEEKPVKEQPAKKRLVVEQPAEELFAKAQLSQENIPKEQHVEEKCAVEPPAEQQQATKEEPANDHPDEEQSAKTLITKERSAGEVRFEMCRSERKNALEELEKRLNGDLNEEEKRKILENIRRIEIEIRAPKRNEELIEQPATSDFILAINDMEKFIKDERECSEKLKRKLIGLNEWEERKIKKEIKAIECGVKASESQLELLIEYGYPRCIATHSYGLRKNYSHPQLSDGPFFVDAAIAKLSDDERSRIQSSDTKGTVFGFRENTKPITGEIVPVNEIETKSENVRFWKSGRSTRHTEGGMFCCNHFYPNLQGFSKNICYGKFTHVQFKTYCQICAPTMECDLVETSLLEELKCEKCEVEIPQESKKSELWAYNCFVVRSKERLMFSDKGDSGAVIFDEQGRAWGIIVGIFEKEYCFTVAISLDIAIKALNEEFKTELGLKPPEKQLKLWCFNPAKVR